MPESILTDLWASTLPSCWPGLGFGSSWGMALVLPPSRWPLEVLGRVPGAASPPLCGSPWPPRRVVSALTGSGGTCHSLPLHRPLCSSSCSLWVGTGMLEAAETPHPTHPTHRKPAFEVLGHFSLLAPAAWLDGAGPGEAAGWGADAGLTSHFLALLEAQQRVGLPAAQRR